MNQKLGISVAEAAKRLGISTRLAYDWARRADFPAFKVGNRIVVYEKGLEEWVRKMVEDTAAKRDDAGQGISILILSKK